MKSRYYVNDRAESTGEHEVHKEGCFKLKQARNTTPLGRFYTCHEAVATSKHEHYDNSDGCFFCSRACHSK